MKKCCFGPAVVLVSLVALGVGRAQISFHGVLNPNGHATWVDTVIASIDVLIPDTFPTPGWGSDSVAYDTFDFPDIADQPAWVQLQARVDGQSYQQMFLEPENGTWYPFTGTPAPPPEVMFWSLQHGIGAEPGGADPRPQLRVNPSMLVDRVAIQAQVAGRGPVRLEIVDAAGNRARSFGTDKPDRVITQVWLGDDDAGQRLPEGVYFCRLTAGRTAIVRKLILAR